MGVLYDNNKEYDKAIKYYRKFLALCQTINDANGKCIKILFT
jgi:tetratricopeptide (TPR) repeat protein